MSEVIIENTIEDIQNIELDFTEYHGISIDDIEIETEAIEEELLAKYNYKEDDSLADIDQFIVVNGCPKAPESKLGALSKVINKVFSSVGEIANMEVPVENGSTKGFAFIQYTLPESAKKALKLLNGKQLDNKHKFIVNSFKDLEEYGSPDFSAEFKEPELSEPKGSDSLNNWLLDSRDQFFMAKDMDSQLVWNRGSEVPELICESSKWVEQAPPRFTVDGRFLITLHEQGAASWGTDSMIELNKFPHVNAKRFDISKTGKFLVTFSPEPIRSAYASFTEESIGHNIAIWDIQTGTLLKTFPLPPISNLKQKPPTWPFIQWTSDDLYCARLGPDAIATYDTSKGLKLHEIIKVENIQSFQFSPSKCQVGRTTDNVSDILTYWTPELTNQNCKVTVMEFPRKRVLRSVNVIQVASVSFYWQNIGHYLAVKIDRWANKTRTKISSNIEIINFKETNFPVTKLELTERVLALSWEPKADRFATISIDENTSSLEDTLPSKIVQFFNTLLTPAGSKSWVLAYQTGRSHTNRLSWSPLGRVLCVGTAMENRIKNSELKFFDMDYTGTHNIVTKLVSAEEAEKLQPQKKQKKPRGFMDQQEEEESLSGTQLDRVGKVFNKGNGLRLRELAGYTSLSYTDFSWDSTGRFFSVFCSSAKVSAGNGYKIFAYNGKILRQEDQMGFKWLSWRPRPQVELSAAELKKIKKQLGEYSKKFKEIDSRANDLNFAKAKEMKRKLFNEWKAYREETAKKSGDYKLFDFDPIVENLAEGDHIVEEIISTTTTVVDDE
ncbi:hypothetical protein QEN19_003180 [Hanseniaspora menglaensis]